MIEFLFAVTGISLMIAAVASVVAWRTVRENRRRSAARIARLADVLRSAEPAESAPVTVAHLLDASRSSAYTGGTPLLLGVVTTLVLGVALATLMTRPNAAAAGPAGPNTDQHVASTGSPESAPASLDLIALTHERGPGGEFELRGEVHNPQNGTTLENVTAVAMLFDPQGAFVTSSRAPLETSTIADGADATFVISVPDGQVVGRYRVSFRTGDRIIPHTDRRDGTLR
jgi:hypothetical protein